MFKYAGVVLDFYDDMGATLKEKFPNVETVPSLIKEANVVAKENLPMEAFALIANDSGIVMRKFACNDPGTTAMSVLYFMEHGDKLPEEAQKVAAVNLVDACKVYGIQPPNVLVKVAGILPFSAGAAGLGALAGTGHGALSKLSPAYKRLNESVARYAGSRNIPGYSSFLKNQISQSAGDLNKKEIAAALGGPATTLAASAIAGHSLRKESGVVDRAKDFAGKVVDRTVGGAKYVRDLPGHLVGSNVAAAAHDVGNAARAETEAAREAIEGNAGELAASIAKRILPGMAAGGIAGGVGGYTHDDTRRGVGRGITGGALGGVLGRVAGPGMATSAIGGGLLGGAKGLFYGKDKNAFVDITGKSPKPIIKKAAPVSDDDYAVKLADGSRHYPINSWDLVKTAEVYFEEESIRMNPEIRRQYAVNLTKKANAMGYPIDSQIAELGSQTYAHPSHLKASLEMRKVACAPGSESRRFLDDLFEKHAEISPDVYSECLRRFDLQNGLNGGWDHVVLDPWASTYGIDKRASVVWEDGADSVTDSDLENLALNRGDLLQKYFSQDLLKGFQEDPTGVFESMPLPQKRVFARLAREPAGSGQSEGAHVS
jgi:hypothetical protein